MVGVRSEQPTSAGPSGGLEFLNQRAERRSMEREADAVRIWNGVTGGGTVRFR